MNIFESISILGYRRLRSVDLSLKPLNVIIGANGSGKTTLLDVFTLLAATAAGSLAETIGYFGGLPENLTNLHSVSAVKAAEFRLKRSIPDKNPLEYHISLEPRGVGYSIGYETLQQDREQPKPFYHITCGAGDIHYFETKAEEPGGRPKLIRPTWEYNPSESALSQVPRMFAEPEEFRRLLASSTHYHVLDVSSTAPVRLPQPMRVATLPGRDGGNLVSCLYGIRETDPDRFELIQDTLRAGFPAFERLNFPPVAAGVLAMTWKEKTSSTPFYMHQLSEGTLRFLWLVTLLQSPGLTSVTMIDEPEVSLHPELLALLADLFREASSRTQLIVATHADRLVRFLTPDEVVTTTIEDDGSATFARGDSFELDEWLQDYSLDQLWQMGRMGGRA